MANGNCTENAAITGVVAIVPHHKDMPFRYNEWAKVPCWGRTSIVRENLVAHAVIAFGFFERIKLKPSGRLKVAVLVNLIALAFSRQGFAIDREDPISDDNLIARKGYNCA